LDTLQVPDKVCAHFKDLGDYDYRPAREVADADENTEVRSVIDLDERPQRTAAQGPHPLLGGVAGDAEATSQSLTHPLPHPVPELARSEHLDVRHPGENPARQFLATGDLQAELQRAVPALPQCLPRVPHPLADIGGHLAGEEQAHLPGFARLADAERVFEEGGGVEASRAREVLAGPCERTAAGQGKGLRAPGGCV
jgi:hypothetical protein